MATQETGLARAVGAILGRSGCRSVRFGISVHDLQTGTVVFEHDGDHFFQAASTTKLLTTATALDALQPDYRFCTAVKRTGHIDSSGTLHGDLVLVASGDPNLSNRIAENDSLAFADIDHSLGGMPGSRALPGDSLAVLRKLSEEVHAQGIRRVRGTVRVDVSLFPEGAREMGTFAVISPIVVNDNLIDLELSAGSRIGEPVRLTVSPQTGYASFQNDAVTGEPGSLPTIHISPEQQRAGGPCTVRITGTLPLGVAQHYKHPVEHPSRFARIAFQASLARIGIEVEGGLGGSDTTNDVSEAFEVVASHVSPPIREAVKVVNKVSQNLHAELLTRVVGAVAGGVSGEDAEKAGFRVENEFLTREGLDLSGAIQGDSCGALGHFTPNFMCRFLRMAASLPIREAFMASLPIMGYDGTLHDVARDSPAAGNVRAKTGTLGVEDRLRGAFLVSAKGLAGYIAATSGATYAFAAYINQFPAADFSGMFDAGELLCEIASAIYEHS